MCTLAIYFHQSSSRPLIVAANRDEFYARPAAEPRVVAHDPWVVAGQDLNAGGTWFGVNEHRMVVGLLNRRSPSGPDPTRRSRGLLCLESLQLRSPGAVLEYLQGQRAGDYNGFNLLVADPAEAYVASNGGPEIIVRELPPGLHLLTNLDVNDPTCPRIARSHRLFEAVPLDRGDGDSAPLLAELRQILSDHTVALDPRASAAGNTLCVHTDGYGTRSSAIAVYSRPAERLRYWHAPGPPCRTEYAEVPLPA